MRIGILGSGPVGRSLGKGLAAAGHHVKLGSRTPSKQELQDWLKETKGKVSVGSFADAASHGEVTVLAFLGVATEDIIKLAGPKNFGGKVVIDVTNIT